MPVSAAPLNTTGQPILLPVPLILESKNAGNIDIRLDSEDRVGIRSEALIDTLRALMQESHLNVLIDAVERNPFFSAEYLEEFGYRVNFDSSLLQLEIRLPGQFRLKQSLSIGAAQNRYISSGDRPAQVSGHVNLYTSMRSRSVAGQSTADHSLSGDLATTMPRLGFATFESEFFLDDKDKLIRRGSRLKRDLAFKTMQLTAGDLYANGIGYLPSVPLLGLTLASDSVAKRGRRAFGNTINGPSFFLEQDSEVRLYVNDILKLRRQLPAGLYTLDEFAINPGFNRIQVEIEDPQGKVTSFASSAYTDAQLLPYGKSEMSLSAGYRSTFGNSGLEYTTSPVLTGFLRYGLAQSHTITGFAEVSEAIQLVGAQSIFAYRPGRFSISTALSHCDACSSTEQAGRALADFFLPRTSSGFGQRLALGLEYISPEFGLVTDTKPNSDRYRLNVNYARTLSHDWDLELDGGHKLQHDGESVANLGAALEFRAAQLTSRISSEADWSTNSKLDLTVSLQVNYRFDRLRSASATIHGDQYNASYRQQSRRSGVGAWNTELNVDSQQMEQQNFGVSANYTANRADLGVNHFTSNVGSDESISQSTSVVFGTAIAYSDGQLAVGRPIRDSFVIASAHESLKDNTIFLGRDKYGNYQAKTDWLGPALYSDAQRDTTNTINIDVDDLPLGYDLGSGLISVSPTYKSGYHRVIGSDATVTAVGTVLDDDGEAVSLATGEFSKVGDSSPAIKTVFTNSRGRFSVQGLSPGEWQLRLHGKYDHLRFVLTVPEGTVGLLRADALRPVEE